MNFAARVYRIAGIIGLIEIVPMYFTESLWGSTYPPPVTHPELYYGFAGVTLAWQIVFLLLSGDPLRYRLLMLPAILEKASYAGAAILLFAGGRLASALLVPAGIDAVLGVLFLIAYLRTGISAPPDIEPGNNLHAAK